MTTNDASNGHSKTQPIAEKQYKAYQLHNLRKIPQVQEHLSEDQIHDIEVVGSVFPFKTNNYVVDELINWKNVPNDPMFVLTFTQRDMLTPERHSKMSEAIKTGDKNVVEAAANDIRRQLNPHPAGQMEHNVPDLYGDQLKGMQHKYPETVLFFPSQGQTCHAYCSFCFRWPQFVGMDDLKFAMKEVDMLVNYLQENPRVSDILFTGGDPMVMSPKIIDDYIQPILDADVRTLNTIRFGTKSLSYWPYKYVTDKGHEDVLQTFENITDAGKHVAFMAHFNHPVELTTPAVQEAVRRLRKVGVNLRSQTPLLRNINDDPDLWVQKWREEVRQGIIPYYMFVVRDTGAQDYFGIPLVRAWEIYKQALEQVSGLGRTVRGPSMSAEPGKVEVLGPAEVAGKKVLTLRFLQGRDPAWVDRPFFAEYDENAIWLDDLKPAFEDKFFFETELDNLYEKHKASGGMFQDMPPIEIETPRGKKRQPRSYDATGGKF